MKRFENIEGVEIEEIMKESFTSASNNKEYYKRNTFEITVFGMKSTRKNSKFECKTIKFYCNNSKLDQHQIYEYLKIFNNMKYNKIYNISVWNNEIQISNLKNLSFYQLTRSFIDIIKLINNAIITDQCCNLVEYKKKEV